MSRASQLVCESLSYIVSCIILLYLHHNKDKGKHGKKLSI